MDRFFAHPLFLWMPLKLWQMVIRCPHEMCGGEMTASGIYQKTCQVIDVAGIYNMACEYLVCKCCKRKLPSWSFSIIFQLDVSHRYQFPGILTLRRACDMKVVGLLRQRGSGNSSSQIKNKLTEQHSEEWTMKTIQYLSQCQGFSLATTTGLIVQKTFENPPDLAPIPG